MEANELMIGDWVLTLESTHKEKVYAQIWAIEEGQTSILVKKDNCNWFVDIEWIEPISLTSDILKKNGFEYYHKNFASTDYDSPFKLEMVEWPDENGNGGLWLIKGLFKIRFVHELQHALRLCGIDKTIEL